MKKVDGKSIFKLIMDSLNGVIPTRVSFQPAADEKIVFANWTQRMQQGKI